MTAEKEQVRKPEKPKLCPCCGQVRCVQLEQLRRPLT